MSKKGDTTVPAGSVRSGDGDEERYERDSAAITVVWNLDEPERIGESAALDGSGLCFVGRSDTDLDAVGFSRVRGGESTPTGPLSGDTVSRRHLRFDLGDDVPTVTNIGRLAMRVDGDETKSAALTGTHVIEIVGHSSFLYSMRPRRLAEVPGYPVKAFGEADAIGIVGEGPEVWKLRRLMAFVAAFADDHVFVQGETGTGKELVARGIHALSPRAGGRFVDCNLATVAATLVGHVLAGNRKDHPNVGTPERIGLLEAAAKGTLLLDEVGEVHADVLAAFLRAMDSGASYHCGGDRYPSHADVRFVCSSNRGVDGVKQDFVERCKHFITSPTLAARCEDIPLIARHLVLSASSVAGSPAQRFVRPGRRRPEVRIEQELMTSLVLRDYPGNVRALARALRDAMAVSRRKTMRLSTPHAFAVAPTVAAAPPREPTKAMAEAALERHFGNLSAAARELGVSRDVLRGILGTRKVG